MPAISLDFCLALHLHLRYKELVTVGRMVRVVVGIWVFASIATLLNIWYRKQVTYVCVPLFFLCLLVTTTAYFRVFRIVHHHQTQIHSLELQVPEPADHEDGAPMNITEQRKSLIAKFLIYCLLLVCYLPFCVTRTCDRPTNQRLRFCRPRVNIRNFCRFRLLQLHPESLHLLLASS